MNEIGFRLNMIVIKLHNILHLKRIFLNNDNLCSKAGNILATVGIKSFTLILLSSVEKTRAIFDIYLRHSCTTTRRQVLLLLEGYHLKLLTTFNSP